MAILSREQTANGITPPLSQAGGYVVVVVIGLIFAFSKLTCHLRCFVKYSLPEAMVFVTRVLKKTAGEDNSKTEM